MKSATSPFKHLSLTPQEITTTSNQITNHLSFSLFFSKFNILFDITHRRGDEAKDVTQYYLYHFIDAIADIRTRI